MNDDDLKTIADGVEEIAELVVKQNDRIARIEGADPATQAHYLSFNHGNGIPGDLIPKSMAENPIGFEREAARMPQGTPFRRVDSHMAAQAWFGASTLAQLPSVSKGNVGMHQEQANKLYAALQNERFGSADAAQKAAIGEDTGSGGDNLVPTLVEDDVMRLITDSSKLFPICRQMALRTNITKIPDIATALTVGWLAEHGTLTGTEPVLSQLTVKAEKLYGRATMSIEVVQDSAPGLLALLLAEYSNKMGGELDKELVLGDGATPAITGILGTSGVNTLTGTAAGRDMDWGKAVSTFTEAGEASTRDDGVWVCSHRGLASLLGMTDSGGLPIVQWGGATKEDPTPVLLGRRIVSSARWGGSATLDDSTADNTTILFGPPSTVIAGTRMGMQWDVTDQVNWAKFQVDARLVARFGAVTGVGAAWTALSEINVTPFT